VKIVRRIVLAVPVVAARKKQAVILKVAPVAPAVARRKQVVVRKKVPAVLVVADLVRSRGLGFGVITSELSLFPLSAFP
jgi:hypothetical protein